MRMHIIIQNTEFDPWDKYSGDSYFHKSYLDKPGQLWLTAQNESLDTYSDRQEVNKQLAKCATFTEKKKCLDEWAEADIIEGCDGMIMSAESYREWRDYEGEAESSCLGAQYSRVDPTGLYTADGVKIGSSCHCEDYPCCGH